MTTIMVDDTDGSIVYSGPWSLVPNSGAYAGSVHESTTVNSSASLTFTGSSISIYGSIPACISPIPSGYWISMRLANDTVNDPIPPLFVSGPLPCAPQPQNNVLFYSADTLSEGARVVGIHNLQGGLPLAVDFFSYVQGGPVASSVLASSQTAQTMPATAVTPLSVISAIGSTVLETVTVPTTIDGQATSVAIVIPTVISQTSVAPSTSTSKNSTGRTVGVVITSILAFVLLISLLFHLRRRRLLRRKIKRTYNALDKVHPSGNLGGEAATDAVHTRSPVLPPFTTLTSPAESSASDTLYSLTDVSYSSTHPLSTVATRQHLHHPYHAEDASEIGINSTTSNAADAFPSSLPLDEKRTAPYQLQWTSSSEPEEAIPPTHSSSSMHPHSPPHLPRSFHNRPVSSIAPSEAAPAYYSHDPSTGNRLHYRSGMSTLTTATESIPPAYEAEHAPPLPPLPTSGFGFNPSRPESVESLPRQ